MKRLSWKMLAPVSLMALAACSAAPEEEAPDSDVSQSVAADMATAPSTEEAATAVSSDPLPGLGERPQIPMTLPKMAYVLDYGFRLAGEQIAPLQEKHADMCEAQGPYNCQIISLTRSGEEEDEITGELQLAVVADKARLFGKMLSDAANAVDAEAFKANIQGEDLSKSIVDTEARLRSRIALRDRLLEVLETRKGTVQELVEAERGVAAVNEEIDQAQSWLKEQQERVAYSRVTVSYDGATPGGSFLKPVEAAIGSLGSILGTLVAMLIVLGAIAVPVLAGVLGVRAWRRTAAPLAEA